jgi:hypothetical protein
MTFIVVRRATFITVGLLAIFDLLTTELGFLLVPPNLASESNPLMVMAYSQAWPLSGVALKVASLAVMALVMVGCDHWAREWEHAAFRYWSLAALAVFGSLQLFCIVGNLQILGLS